MSNVIILGEKDVLFKKESGPAKPEVREAFKSFRAGSDPKNWAFFAGIDKNDLNGKTYAPLLRWLAEAIELNYSGDPDRMCLFRIEPFDIDGLKMMYELERDEVRTKA